MVGTGQRDRLCFFSEPGSLSLSLSYRPYKNKLPALTKNPHPPPLQKKSQGQKETRKEKKGQE